MELPDSIRKQFQAHGAAGGRIRSARMTEAERQSAARTAALRRWTRQRFGASSFAELGLPGGELIDQGLADLAAARETLESLVVSLAAPRLKREGVPMPREGATSPPPDPDMRLYRLLESRDGSLAHARYLAYLRRAASFADACRQARSHGATS